MTEERRTRRIEQMKARYRVGDTTRPPTPAPADLRERLSAAIARTLANEPERFLDLLRTRAASAGRRAT
jgi:hypothetical protein